MGDLPQWIQSFSYAGIAALVFAESGLLVGFFLPGDSLLITAGVLTRSGQLHWALLVLCVTAAAIAGDSTGYTLGRASSLHRATACSGPKP